MEDITPRLIEAITEDFRNAYDGSRKIQDLLDRVKKGTATHAQAQEYSLEVSRLIGQAYQRNISSAVLPDGRMYYNIASRLIPSTLDENYNLVSRYSMDIQQRLNERAGTKLKAQAPVKDEERVDRIVDMASNAEEYDTVADGLLRAMENYSQSIVDETVRANAEFQHKTGLSPMIIRKATHKCCDWCSSLAGRFRYPAEIPDDVFRRHKSCRCIVDYDPDGTEKNFQNVHTKYWQSAEERAKIEARKTVGLSKERRIAARAMANGPRRGALTAVTAEEESQIRRDAAELKIPQGVLSFNTGSCTSFDDETGLIHIRGDIFPSEFAENPDSILSARCALAHEYYGHLKHYPSRFEIGDWRDEFEASYRAALDTPNLTDDERAMLMIDAFDRARNANVSVDMNSVARRVIYGIE